MRAGDARSLPKPTCTCARARPSSLARTFRPLRSTSTHVTADPVRTRKLLLKRSELQSLIGSVERRGYTWSARALLEGGGAKALGRPAKGKKQHDKRAVGRIGDWERTKPEYCADVSCAGRQRRAPRANFAHREAAGRGAAPKHGACSALWANAVCDLWGRPDFDVRSAKLSGVSEGQWSSLNTSANL